MSYVGIIFTFVFVNNVVLSRLLGLGPVVTGTKDVRSALGLGALVAATMTVAALLASLFNTLVFRPLHAEFLRIGVLVLATAAVVEAAGLLLEKSSSPLAAAIRTRLPHVTANCAVLGVGLLVVKADYTAPESLVAGLAGGLGFILAATLLSAIREKSERENVPQALRGAPIAFISAGLMAMAFMALDSALLKNLFG